MATKLYVRKLTKSERDFIYSEIDNPKIGYRALIIALSHKGYPVSAIWKKLNVHPDSVREWIRRFNKYGVDGILEKKKSGRKPTISKTIERKIVSIFATKPIELGLPFNTWSLRKLQAYVIKRRIVKRISHEEIRRILQSAGLSYKRSREELASDDPKYESKMYRVQRLLKRPNCAVLFEDEKTIVAKEYPGYEWCLVSRIVKKNQRINGRAVMFAAYAPHTRTIYRKYFDRLTKENFMKFLDYIDSRFNEDVYLILDNHRSHFVGKKYKKIKLVFLPTNSPKLNLMDTQFSVIQREVLSNSSFESIDEVESRIDAWIRSFNEGD